MKKKNSLRSSAPVSWPQAIPRTQRRAVDTAHAFYFHHQPLWENEHFEDHQVELRGNLLIVVARGSVVLRRGEETCVIHQGDGCLISNGLVAITEVPPSTAGSADLYYCFFSDKVLRQRFTNLAKVERLALGMTTAPTALPRLTNLVAQLGPIFAETSFRFPDDFTRILNVVFNRGWSGAWMFLKSFFARRTELHLYLEKYMLPVTPVEQLETAYPSGRTQFRRDYRAQYDIPLERWLTWRRLQIARMKIRCNNKVPIERIAKAVGYQNFHRFRHQFRIRFQLWPEEVWRNKGHEELSTGELTQLLTPFWHWHFSEYQQTREASVAFITRAQIKQYPRREQRRLRYHELVRRQNTPPVLHGDGSFLTAPPTNQNEPQEILDLDDTGFSKFVEYEVSLDPAEIELALAA